MAWDRVALAPDARRYHRLVAAEWTVLRLSWEDVMLHLDEVVSLLRLAAGPPRRESAS